MASAAVKAYLRRFAITMTAYVAAVAVATGLSNSALADGPG